MGADVHYSAEELLAQAGWLGALARTLVADPGEADDLVQETWLAALKRPPTGDRPLRPWLARVARNLARMRRRSEGARGERERSVGRVDREQPTSAELVERLEGQTLLVQALAELDEPYRSTVLLAYFEQRGSAEIAARDGVSEGTVRWRLHQAIQQLRTRLDKRHADDRSAWIALLLPLARTETGALATASAAAGGVLGVGLYLKLSSIAALLFFVVWFSVRGLRPDPAQLALVRATSTEAVAFAPVEERARPLEDNGERAPRVALASASAPSAAAATIGAATSASLRVVDEQRRPVAGVRFDLGSYAPFFATEVASDADGRVHLRLGFAPDRSERAGSEVETEILARSRVWSLAPIRRTIRVGSDNELGEFVVQPAGVILGRVVDEHGVGVAEAEVGVADGLADLELRENPESAEHARHPSLLVTTDERGQFELDGVASGMHRVVASREGFRCAVSGHVEVRAQQSSQLAELVLVALPADDTIRGRVVDPLGQPVARARISYRIRSGTGSSAGELASDELASDELGRFEIRGTHGGSCSLSCTDRETRFGRATLENVASGAQDVLVQLGELHLLRLHVTTRGGRALESYTVFLKRDFDVLESAGEGPHVDGRSNLRLPDSAFRLEVEAPGCARFVQEIEAPARIEGVLEVVLDPGAKLHGRVMAADKPVEGATLLAYHEARQPTDMQGFPVRIDPELQAQTKSGADGRFELGIADSGRVYVRAEAEGFAPAELGPLDLASEAATRELVFELGQGGTIEGRVLGETGEPVAGAIVGFSRGDGRAITKRADSKGAFRAERLMVGRWLVRKCESEIDQGLSRGLVILAPGQPLVELPSNCEVRAGEVTRFDIDLREAQRSECVLRGRLATKSGDLGVWAARLVREPGVPGMPEGNEVTLAADGGFELRAPAAGRWRMMLFALEGPHSGLMLSDVVQLDANTTTWSCELASGMLTVRGKVAGEGERGLWAAWSRMPSGALALIPLLANSGAVQVELRAPPGTYRLVHAGEFDELGRMLELPALAECTLAEGGSATLTVP